MFRIFVFLLTLITTSSFAQKAAIVKLDHLQRLLKDNSHTIQVVNFWATWCAPCVKELPLFEALNAKKGSDVNITLISMDLNLDPNPDKVFKFIERKGLQTPVLILNEQDPNVFIDKIEKQWSGALPATLVINTKTGQRKFIEKELHQGDLERIIDELK